MSSVRRRFGKIASTWSFPDLADSSLELVQPDDDLFQELLNGQVSHDETDGSSLA